MWGLDEPGQDSQGLGDVNPTDLTTARLGGIFFEISAARLAERERWRAGLSKTAMTSFRT